MAYGSKSEQRLAGSKDYAGSEGTLTSSTVKESDMANSAPDKIWGKVQGGKTEKIFGRTQTRSGNAELSGKMKGSSFTGGKKGK